MSETFQERDATTKQLKAEVSKDGCKITNFTRGVAIRKCFFFGQTNKATFSQLTLIFAVFAIFCQIREIFSKTAFAKKSGKARIQYNFYS